ncbi:MAG: YggU family protein [Campylobacteraceae bacterium 4484_4]|nr:MAG: YggU family protein [Campylobacteraceae bacterium 4484_4]
MWYERKGERVVLSIRAVPGSSRNLFAEIMDDALKIKIKAPAVEGAANRELVKFLGKSFKIPKSEIRFLSGDTSKRKRIEMPCNDKVAQFIKEREDGRESV